MCFSDALLESLEQSLEKIGLMYGAVIFEIVEGWKQPTPPSRRDWLNKLCNTCKRNVMLQWKRVRCVQKLKTAAILCSHLYLKNHKEHTHLSVQRKSLEEYNRNF